MIYRYLLACVLLFLLGCTNSPSIDYTDEYSRTTDANRAVNDTQEAMNTDDVIDTLSAMLGSPDQSDVVIASNVRIINNLDEINDSAYRHYTLRVADNINMPQMPRGYDKDEYSRRGGYDKDEYSTQKYPKSKKSTKNSDLRMKLGAIKAKYPRAVIAVNKQDRIIAVALDSLESQALAQASPRVFYVLQGQTLKQTVSRWAKQAKWGVQWSIPKDYTMVASATIFGEFSTQGGSLDQLLGTLRYLDQPLKAQFTRNKMVVIRDGSYNSSIMAVMP